MDAETLSVRFGSRHLTLEHRIGFVTLRVLLIRSSFSHLLMSVVVPARYAETSVYRLAPPNCSTPDLRFLSESDIRHRLAALPGFLTISHVSIFTHLL